VLVTIDADEYPALAKRFGVVALPDIRFLSPQGEERRRFQDFQGPVAFAEALSGLLKEVAAGAFGDNLIVLSDDESELKERFNRDVGNMRLILVLSPT
jgi:thioredoxin-like negative regulator of GroEL